MRFLADHAGDKGRTGLGGGWLQVPAPCPHNARSRRFHLVGWDLGPLELFSSEFLPHSNPLGGIVMLLKCHFEQAGTIPES